MTVALFGGAFDPPHLGHARVVTSLIEQQLVAEVWMVPARQHPFAKQMSGVEHRLKMCQLWWEALPKPVKKHTKIETWECRPDTPTDRPSYSLETLRHFRTLYPADKLVLVIGSDNLATLDKWWHSSELVTEFEVWVYPRAGYPLPADPPNVKPLHNLPEIAVSSTQIRETCRHGTSLTELSALVPRAVAEYSIEHHLYAAAAV
jgi:nicotinate-nucleotide adenylyltransferase